LKETLGLQLNRIYLRGNANILKKAKFYKQDWRYCYCCAWVGAWLRLGPKRGGEGWWIPLHAAYVFNC